MDRLSAGPPRTDWTLRKSLPGDRVRNQRLGRNPSLASDPASRNSAEGTSESRCHLHIRIDSTFLPDNLLIKTNEVNLASSPCLSASAGPTSSRKLQQLICPFLDFSFCDADTSPSIFQLLNT